MSMAGLRADHSTSIKPLLASAHAGFRITLRKAIRAAGVRRRTLASHLFQAEPDIGTTSCWTANQNLPAWYRTPFVHLTFWQSLFACRASLIAAGRPGLPRLLRSGDSGVPTGCLHSVRVASELKLDRETVLRSQERQHH